MKKVGSYKSITVIVAIFGLTSLALSAVCYAVGVRINTTKSIPIGLYLTSSKPVEKGAYVLFCPPQEAVFDMARERGYIGSGFCPGGYGYMMKRVSATENDKVSVTDNGVRVNDELLPHSKPFQADKAGRPLPRYNLYSMPIQSHMHSDSILEQHDTYTLGNDELLLMSDVSDTSFDARYFGPVNRCQVRTVIRPVITW